MEMEDEKAYFLYHRKFSRGRKMIDDAFYKEIWDAYQAAEDPKERKRLARYLKFETKWQKNMTYNERCML